MIVPQCKTIITGLCTGNELPVNSIVLVSDTKSHLAINHNKLPLSLPELVHNITCNVPGNTKHWAQWKDIMKYVMFWCKKKWNGN